MYGLTRATTTLIAAAGAGLLIWFATKVDDTHVGGFWDVYGLLAGAGLLMASQLFEVTPWDPMILSAAPVLLVMAALIAAAIPARRAASVDPAKALRAE